jgi:hypothetical protein
MDKLEIDVDVAAKTVTPPSSHIGRVRVCTVVNALEWQNAAMRGDIFFQQVHALRGGIDGVTESAAAGSTIVILR